MRGRRPLGAEAVTRLEGSETARKKMEVLLEAMTGKITVAEACAKLGVGEAAYHKLRQRMLQGAKESLEPRTPGRPAQVSIVDPKVAELEEEVRQLRIDLRASQIREEIALLMPHLIKVPDPAEKKEADGPIVRREKRHAEQIRRICELKQREKQHLRIRGSAAQQQRRCVERTVRIETVAFDRWMSCCGLSRDDTARRVALSKSTVSSWERLWRESRLEPLARGRPAERTDRETREAIMALFQLMGPGVGLAVLQECFPGVARRELEDLQRRYRDVHTKRSQVLVHALIWPRVASVWAMDYAVPPQPVDGIYGSILVVRDLASGMQLASLPV